MNNSIDLSYEVNLENLNNLNYKNKCWMAKDISENDWKVFLSKKNKDEIKRIIDIIVDKPLPILIRSIDEFQIDTLKNTYLKIKKICDDGVGFAVLDKLPIEDHDISIIKNIYWILGQLMGKNVAQKWDGTMIYDVIDTGKKYSYGVRGSATNIELCFHTDNAFGIKPPEYVGLLCKFPAKKGGTSRFCSLYTVHKKMKDYFPKELERLYKPMYFDRQAEHAIGKPITTFAPFFTSYNGKLKCRANTSLVKKGYDLLKKEMDNDLISAIKAIEKITSDDALWIEAPLTRGQIQYLNNFELAHYRSEFEDYNDTNKRRHLFRLWHRSEGNVTYDGI